MTITISVTYDLVWRYLETNYYFDKEGRCFNIKSGREIKMILNGRSKGFCFMGNFISLKKIKSGMKKIEKTNCPF